MAENTTSCTCWVCVCVYMCMCVPLCVCVCVSVEKSDGEYQHSPCSRDEERQIQPGLPLHTQVPSTGQGQAHHSRQQCPSTQVCGMTTTEPLSPSGDVSSFNQNAAVAPRPLTTHPLVWAEQHKHTTYLCQAYLPDTSLHYSTH